MEPYQPPSFESVGAVHPEEPQQKQHPVALFFHFFFKISSIVVYLFMSMFYSNFVIVFVSVLILVCCDFWTVKNVTGRLLVGLRWWNEVEQDGQNSWRFESLDDESILVPREKTLFWTGVLLSPLCWITLLIALLFQLSLTWVPLVILAIVLSFANCFGYIRCARDARNKLQSAAVQYVAHKAFQSAFSSAV